MYYLLPTTIFVACDRDGRCVNVLEVPWAVPDSLAGLHIASSSNWLRLPRGRFISVLHERRLHAPSKQTDYSSRYAVLDLRDATLSISARTIMHGYLVNDRSHGRIEFVTSIRPGPERGEVQLAYGSGDCLARVATLSIDAWNSIPVDVTLALAPTAPAEMRQRLRRFNRQTR